MFRYTTVSQPEFVDGWLGMQLSDKLWFPCWNAALMSESAAKIMPLITSQERSIVSLRSSAAAIPASSSFSTGQTPLCQAATAASSFNQGSGNLASFCSRVAAEKEAISKNASPAGVETGQLYSIIEALISSQQAMHDRHHASLQALHNSLISNQCLLQEALAATQRQLATAQHQVDAAHSNLFALAAVGVALITMAFVRGHI
jgi:hypothetical protein